MDGVGAALGDHADLAAGAASEFGGGDAGLDGKFLDGIADAEVIQVGVDLGIHVAGAVPEVDIRLGAGAGDVKAEDLGAGGCREDAGGDEGEIESLPSVERHVVDVAAIDDAAEGALIVFEEWGDGFDLDGFGGRANFEG